MVWFDLMEFETPVPPPTPPHTSSDRPNRYKFVHIYLLHCTQYYYNYEYIPVYE